MLLSQELAAGLSNVFNLPRINQVPRPNAIAGAGENEGFPLRVRLEGTRISESLTRSTEIRSFKAFETLNRLNQLNQLCE